MAQGWVFECSECQYALEAWSDGNPYYYDTGGKLVVQIIHPDPDTLEVPRQRKIYVYHPSHPKWPIVGNDVRHICLDCGRKFYVDIVGLEEVDDRHVPPPCIRCDGPNVVALWDLQGRTCPKCRRGQFGCDPDSIMIS